MQPEFASPVTTAVEFQAATGADDAQLADLERFRSLLEDWNARFNLVGPSALAEFWSRHAYDSWQLLPFAPGALRWADLGAGAGLPGAVLSIFLKARAGAEVHLIDSLAKRCRFLREVTAVLDLPACVHHARAEALTLTVDVVTARAVAPLGKLFGYALPYMQRGATGLFLKGENAERELEAAAGGWTFDADLSPSRSDPRGRVVAVRSLSARARSR